MPLNVQFVKGAISGGLSLLAIISADTIIG